jgi:hypothetical protein
MKSKLTQIYLVQTIVQYLLAFALHLLIKNNLIILLRSAYFLIKELY